MPAVPLPHQVLGLSFDASAKEIKKRYHQLSLKHHPDKNLDNKEQANIKMVQINDAYQKMMAGVANAKIDSCKAQKSTKCESSRFSNREQQSRSPKAHQGPEANAHAKSEEHAQQKTEEDARHRQHEQEKRKREEKMNEQREKQREEDKKRRKEESQRLVFERLKKKECGREDVQRLAYRVWSTLEEEYGGGLRPGPGDNRRTLPRTKDQLSFFLFDARATHSAMFLLHGLFRKVQAAPLKDLAQRGPADSFCFATLRSVLSQVMGGLAIESQNPVISEDDRLRNLFQQDLLSEAGLKIDKIYRQGRALHAKIARYNGDGIADTVQTWSWELNIGAVDRLYDAMSQTLEKFKLIDAEIKILQSIEFKKGELGESQRRDAVASFEKMSTYCDEVWSEEFLA